MPTKNCHKCLTPQPIEMYWKDKASKDGLFSVCKTCGRENNATKYHRDIDKERERNAAWHKANKLHRASKRAALQRWVVYRLDFPDGRFYFGSTNDLPRRVSVHKTLMRKGTHRNPLIRREGYGPDSFVVQVVADVDSKQQARNGEARFIDDHIGHPLCLNFFRVPC